MKLSEACENKDNGIVIAWLKSKRLLPENVRCKCGLAMKFYERKDSLDGFAWRCSKCGI